MEAKKIKTQPSKITFFLAAILVGIFIWQLHNYLKERSNLIAEHKRDVIEAVRESTQLVAQEVDEIVSPAIEMSRYLTDHYTDIPLVKKKLTKLITKSPLFEGVGIAYIPKEMGHGVEQKYIYFVQKEDEEAKEPFVDKYYDYTVTPWYRQGINKGQTWIESYFEVSTGSYVIRYVISIYRFDQATGSRKPVALLFVDISRRKLMTAIEQKERGGPSSYTMIVSKEGDLITYPVAQYIDQYRTLMNLSRLPGKAELAKIDRRLKRGGAGLMTYYDDLTRESFYVYFSPIKKTGWHLLLFSPRTNLFFQLHLRRLMMQMILVSILLLLMFLIFFTRTIKNDKSRWWALSLSFSIMLLGALIFQLWISFYTAQRAIRGDYIGNLVDLNRFTSFIERRNQQLNKPELIYVPTGIWIEYILKEHDRVMMSGILWQRYAKTVPKNIERSIGILNAYDLKLDKLYEVQNNDYHIIGWKFRTLLNIEFDYLLYPLDSQNLVIKLFNPDFEKNIMLTPDFDSYTLTEIAGKTGLGKVYHEAAWYIKNSYFSYELTDNSTDFGIPHSVRKKQFPNLLYNINITRDVTNPLIGYVFPLVLLAAILFYVLVEASITKVSLSSTLARVSGLFLATVFAHQSLRSGLAQLAGTGTGGITYLEYLYFIMYFFLMLILNFTFFIYFKQKNNHDSMLAKSFQYIYWPILMICSLIVTLYFFY